MRCNITVLYIQQVSARSPINFAFIVHKVSIVVRGQRLQDLQLLLNAGVNSERSRLDAQLLSSVIPHVSLCPARAEGKEAKALTLEQIGKD